jgi:hypothetical protein
VTDSAAIKKHFIGNSPLVGSSRSVGSCRANAMFLAFVPAARIDCLPALIARTADLKLSL